MEEAIVMKIIIGLTIITILGFINLRRENKALDSQVSLFAERFEMYEYEFNRLRHKVLVLNDEVISLGEGLSQRDEQVAQISHRVDAHEIRLFP